MDYSFGEHLLDQILQTLMAFFALYPIVWEQPRRKWVSIMLFGMGLSWALDLDHFLVSGIFWPPKEAVEAAVSIAHRPMGHHMMVWLPLALGTGLIASQIFRWERQIGAWAGFASIASHILWDAADLYLIIEGTAFLWPLHVIEKFHWSYWLGGTMVLFMVSFALAKNFRKRRR